ncbi:MAG: ImmA/IrrE family metallo-endopeptidase [Bacteroidales bacterium]|nr:ImmA/IrrE family metallo-endopeptidase [Candidatus Colimorpha merdihippi]
MIEKDKVHNAAADLTKVGAEVYDICVSRGLDPDALKIRNLREKENLSQRMIAKIVNFLKLEENLCEYFDAFQKNYQEQKRAAKIAYEKAMALYRELKPAEGFLGDNFNSGVDRLDDFVSFFGVESEDEIQKKAQRIPALFKTQNQTKVNQLLLQVWLRKGEIECAKRSFPTFRREKLQEWLDNGEWHANLNNPEYFISLPAKFAEMGICLLLLPYLQKTVYGSVQWIEQTPVVMVSDRERDLATAWVTLFHEIGHVLRHGNRLALDHEIAAVATARETKIEREANESVNRYLFKSDNLRKIIFSAKKRDDIKAVVNMAISCNVNDLFVGYWMRKAQFRPKEATRIKVQFR